MLKSEHWPKVTISVSRHFSAEHSLECQPERHVHEYRITCEASHEINPAQGACKSYADWSRDVDLIVDRLRGSYLNSMFPLAPTAEILACWVLAKLPPYWDAVTIDCYEGFRARIDRHNITNGWMEKLRACPT